MARSQARTAGLVEIEMADGVRVLALHLPALATDRRAEPCLPRERPLAAWMQVGGRRLLVVVDAAASAAGLPSWMTA